MNKPILKLLYIYIFLVVVFMFSAAAFAHGNFAYAEIGIGNNTDLTGASIPWEDGGGTGTMFAFGYAWEVEPTVQVEINWSHYSQIDVGPPFNDKNESSLDHFGIKLRKRF